MESLLEPLLPLFERERAAGNAVAVGVIVQTVGSTYRKAGALMLIASNGDYAGLLSGGCLEGDLREHARSVIETGEARVVEYDTRGGDDLIWGLGLGCEGAIRVLLLRSGPHSNWEPLTHLAQCAADYRGTAVGAVVESGRCDLPVGTVILPHVAGREPAVMAAIEAARRSSRPGWFESADPPWKVFVFPLTLPPRLLLLGAGPDAFPVVDLAARLSWKVTLVDHRPTYADPSHFPAAERVVLARPDELLEQVDTGNFAAAVVMSHHLPSDLQYLRALAQTTIPYVGLLGPAARRERLLADLGSDAGNLRQRLHAPVGLSIGGRRPEAVALSIVSEIHAVLHGADGGRHGSSENQPVVERTPIRPGHE